MNENLPEEITFGEWLHQRRRALDLTQQGLADQVGCAHITLRRIESGTLKPSKEMALILLEKLGVPQADREAWLPFTRGLSGLPGKANVSSASKPSNTLPTSLTSFIGREKEQREIIDLLSRSHLITLTGSGGVGKTRLAIQVSRAVLEKYPDGVWLVEFAPILDPILVPRITATAIGLRDEPQRPLIEMLCDYVRQKKMLLVLDNCEHLVEAVASMSDKLLLSGPNLRILASSREALGVDGETIYHVPSLGLPDLKYLPPFQSLVRYEAIALFIDRALSALPSFTVTNDHAPLIAQICRCLDGIPLAIELAAAKTRVLSIEQIAERLDDRFKLLTTGNRTALERHQTLRATIDWSYNLLSHMEQICFRRMSVFVGGWTLEAAESICGSESPSGDVHHDDVLHRMEQLINKSLVTMEELQHKSRYHMLETLRQYAGEKLAESGEKDALRDRHLHYFLTLAETAAPHLIRPEQVEWLNRLEAEHDNLRAALEWSLYKKNPEPALRLTAALGTFWELHSHWKEGARWLDKALAIPMDNPTPAEKAARARALYQDAALAEAMDNLERLQTSAEASLVLCEQGTNRLDLARARFYMGLAVGRARDLENRERMWELCLADFQELEELYWEANTRAYRLDAEIMLGKESYVEIMARNLDLARRAGERRLLSSVLLDAAEFAWRNGDLQQAQVYLEEADRLRAALGLTIGSFFFPDLHACITHTCKDYPRARELYLRAIEKLELVGEKNVRAWTIQFLGILERDDRHLQQAQAHFETALDVKQKVGQQGEVGLCLALLGQVCSLQGDRVAARERFKESLLIAKTTPSRAPLLSLILVSGLFAEVAAEPAAQILAAVHAHYANNLHPPMIPLFKSDFNTACSQARLQLGEGKFEAAWAAGEKLSIYNALDLGIKTLQELEQDSDVT